MEQTHFIRKSIHLMVGFGLCVLLTVPAYGATYYVRPDGGTASECTGLADAPYPGSGINQSCALNHPLLVISIIGNNPTKLAGGDTLIIDGSNNAEYKMGYGDVKLVSSDKCSKSYPRACYMRSIPSGPDPLNPTRILGKGWDTGCSEPPQLWATNGVNRVLNLAKSDNVEIQCLEVTDHSDCQENGPNACNESTLPYGDWGRSGIYAIDSENVFIKNVNIHGMAFYGVASGRLKDWVIEDTRIVGNPFAGWAGGEGANTTATASNSGTLTLNRVRILFNGCGETYPGQQPMRCYSQSQGGYGDGLGMAATAGNWVFNEVNISHNTSDGLDLLYLKLGGSVTIKRSRFEGNAGNQVKVRGTAAIENSIIIGNCGYFDGKPFTETPGFNHCRASGNAIAMRLEANENVSIYNSTITGNGDTVLVSGGSNCTGSEQIISRNNIFLGGSEFMNPNEKSALYWAGGTNLCRNVNLDDDYSVIWGTKQGDSDCDGKDNSLCQYPDLEEPLVTFYSGDEYNVHLKQNSPAISKAVILTGKSNLDYMKNDRGDVWDIGAIEYDLASEEPTCTEDINYCTTQEECTGQGYYWYDDLCHAEPEPLPTCADDILYCSSQSECEGEGYHWYNNVCNFIPVPDPTCAESILYCTNSTDCVAQGSYWYNSTCNTEAEVCIPTWCDLPLIECGQEPLTGGTDSCGNSCTKPSVEWPNCREPEPEPTCADGIQYCLTSSECTFNGNYWYNNTCNIDPELVPTCADGIQYCSSSSDCEGQGYYWYNNFCNIEPEPLPTCADGHQYCSNSAECISQGYYWYNNICGVNEPTCADGIQFCTKRSDCKNQGYYWYNNICNLEPEPKPSCADGIQYCTKKSECDNQGHYWYNNTCNTDPEPVPTCADGIQYCLTSSECTSNGHHWYNNTCHVDPEQVPTCADSIQNCLTSSECTSNGHHWYNNTCNFDPEPDLTCADGIQYCTKRSDCNNQNYYWYNNTCNLLPEPDPTCADGIQYCTKKLDCTNQGYFWYGNQCNTVPEPEPTCADGHQYCADPAECISQGYYWYNNTCGVTAPTCTDGIQYCLTSSDCTANGYHWYNNTCNTEPVPEPQPQASQSTTTEDTTNIALSTTGPIIEDTIIGDEPTTEEEPSKTKDDKTDKSKDKSSEEVDTTTTDTVETTLVSDDSGSTVIKEKFKDKSISDGNSDGKSGGNSDGSGGGGLFITSGSGGFVGKSSDDKTSKTKTKSTTSSGGSTATIPSGTTITSGFSDSTSSITTTTQSTESGETVSDSSNTTILDLEGESYAEIRSQLLDAETEADTEAEADAAGEAGDGGEGEGEGEGEGGGEEAVGEDGATGLIEDFQNGVAQTWGKVVNWFNGLVGNN